MGIRRFSASIDASVTNAYKSNLLYRATGSNMGGSDILEVFSLYGQASSASREEMRTLIKFPVDSIYSEYVSGNLPSNAVYYLRMWNAPHGETVPNGFTLEAKRISGSWDEGHGLDMEQFLYDDDGVTWASSSVGVGRAWISQGGDFTGTAVTQDFDGGTEDLEMNITSFVSDWFNYEASGTGTQNRGVVIKLTDLLATGSTRSYYTKRFFGRNSEWYFRRPVIEARFNDAHVDDRSDFYAANSASSDNSNKLYYFNRPRGVLSDVPGGAPVIRFFGTEDGQIPITASEGIEITSSKESTGVYYVTATVDTQLETIYDRWYTQANVCVAVGEIEVLDYVPDESSDIVDTVINITNLRSTYSKKETQARFNLFIREKNWNPSIYTVTQECAEDYSIRPSKIYYRLRRVIDDIVIYDFNTDTEDEATLMSRDINGNYLYLDMSALEPGYMYEIDFSVKIGGRLQVLDESFKFRVEE